LHVACTNGSLLIRSTIINNQHKSQSHPNKTAKVQTMKIVTAAWFILVAQLALLPSGVTASCEDSKDKFELSGITRSWCDWVRTKFPDPADQLNQCAGRGLTDHCPVLCQKPECLSTTAAPVPAGASCDDRTDAFAWKDGAKERKYCDIIRKNYAEAEHPAQCTRLRLTDHCPKLCKKPECFATAAPVPAPGPTPTPGGNNDLEILKQQVAQVAQQQVQLQADVLKILDSIGDLSKFVMNPATSAPSAFPSAAPSTACQVPNPEFLGDGMCDGGDYNTEVCQWDKGDCDDFNELYPNCNVPDPTKVGDKFCDDQHNLDNPVYNVAACGFDGGDCASGSA